MKAKGCAVLGCFGLVLLLAAVAAMIGVGALIQQAEGPPPTPEPAPGPGPRPTPRQTGRATPTPEPEADPDRFLAFPGELRRFTRDDDGPRYRMHYGFVDYSGRRHDVTCAITKDAVQRASRAFGWNQAELGVRLDAELQEVVDREVARRGLDGHVRVTVREYGGWHRSASRSPEDEPTLAEIERLDAWLEAELPRHTARIEARLFHEHGLRLQKRTVSIDYNTLATAASADVQTCYDALVMSAGPIASDRYFMGLLLAFFQELKYERPPDKVGARDILGLWVPAEVLADGKGDCDSKSLAFAAMWRQRASRVIVILVPEHALIGVEGKPGPGESFVRVGNRYYVLCEVAGPGKLPPGHESISGSFEYVEIEPL
jgi:hypothetical protein